jgi:N-methylhydantoinase B
VVEQLYPVMFDHYKLREGSGGAGLFRGGCGMEFQIRLLRGEASGSVLGDRGRFPPFGLQGGDDGRLAEIEFGLSGRSYRPEHVTKDEGIILAPGDTARVATAGGGGWGDPLQRDPGKVLHDVTQELVSETEAARDYGVKIVGGEGERVVDIEATRELRSRKRAG